MQDSNPCDRERRCLWANCRVPSPGRDKTQHARARRLLASSALWVATVEIRTVHAFSPRNHLRSCGNPMERAAASQARTRRSTPGFLSRREGVCSAA